MQKYDKQKYDKRNQYNCQCF